MDPLDLDATAQADLVRRGEVSAAELVEAAILRAEALNPRLNAIVSPAYEQALDAARGRVPHGPFSGVPFVVKDLVAACAGLPKTECCRFLRANVAAQDSELVARYRRAGLIVLGMTNASEFGILPTTEPALFGATRNPWNLEHSPGGSSGGSAAAVAARIVAMGHANDWGGSIRIPAACCGLFGLKPTRARLSLGPRFGDLLSGLVQEHVVTRSVRDSARLLDATAGMMAGDPYDAPAAERPYSEEVGLPAGRLRIGVWTRPPTGSRVHPDCTEAVSAAVALCEELGHELEEVTMPLQEPELMMGAFATLYAAGVATLVADWAAFTGRVADKESFEPLTWSLAELGRLRTAADYLEALLRLQREARHVATLFDTWDLVLGPTLAEPPAPLGTFAATADNPYAGFMRAGMYTPFTPLANITGQPSMSVPLFRNEAGLPIGVMFTGRFGAEGTLLRFAAELEEARPWADKAPSVASR